MLVAVAPIIGGPKALDAAASILDALGFALAELELEAEMDDA